MFRFLLKYSLISIFSIVIIYTFMHNKINTMKINEINKCLDKIDKRVWELKKSSPTKLKLKRAIQAREALKSACVAESFCDCIAEIKFIKDFNSNIHIELITKKGELKRY